jgi:hypothetical protein
MTLNRMLLNSTMNPTGIILYQLEGGAKLDLWKQHGFANSLGKPMD